MSRGEMPPADDVAAALRELVGRFAGLDDEVQRMQRALTEEIRTRRLVVVGDDGVPRVEITARDAFGHVTVFGRTHGTGSTCVELFANDPSDGDGAEVGLALTVGGDVVATLHIFEGRQPALWIDGARDAALLERSETDE